MPRLPIDVRVYRHTDPGAPPLTGTAGSMVSLLTACLVSGYGASTPTSVTRSGSTVTVSYNSQHNYQPLTVIKISGADQEGYNGLHRIESVSQDGKSFTFTLPDGVTPDSPATGTITVKIAGADWERTHVSDDLKRACFRPTDQTASGYYLYIDDTQSSVTRRTIASGCRVVVNIDERYDTFPTGVDAAVWWYKSDDSTTQRIYTLIADSKTFYLYVNYNNNTGHRIYVFGDIIPIYSYDSGCCMINGDHSSTTLDYPGSLFTITAPGRIAPRGAYLARPLHSVGPSPIIYSMTTFNPVPDTNLYYVLPAPLSYNCIYAGFGITYLAPVLCLSSETGQPGFFRGVTRGTYPGLYSIIGSYPFDRMIFTYKGEYYIALKVYSGRGYYYTDSTERAPKLGSVAINLIKWR